MLNVSTIQGFLVILVNMLRSTSSLSGFQVALIVLISLSISLQFIIFTLLTVLAKSSGTIENAKIVSMNSAVTSLSGLLLIVSTAIAVLATTTGNDQIVAVPEAPNVTR